MSAKEAIELYKSRDTSEKLFRGDKSYLGNKSIRVYSEESAIVKSGRSYEEIMNFLNVEETEGKTEE